jgi:ABC-2 type transport system permease protein
MSRFLLETRLLMAVRLLEMRGTLVLMLTITSLFPLLVVFGFGMAGSGQTHEGMLYIITGSAVSTVTLIGTNITAQRLSWMKERGDFLYYAALPIAKESLLLAVLMVELLLMLPGVLVTLFAGSLIYGYAIQPDPLLLLILLLTALSLSGIGAAIGTLVPNVQLVNLIAQVAGFVVLFAAPVLIPIERLPLPLQVLGWLMPPTYAADALRRVVGGVADTRLLVDIAVLAVSALVSLTAVVRGLRWRLR